MKKAVYVIILMFFLMDAYGETPKEWLTKGYESENVDTAIFFFTKAIDSDPKYIHAYLLRALAKRETGDYKGALEDYNKAIKIAPNFIDAYIGRGKTKRLMGDEAGAKKDLEEARRIKLSGDDFFTVRLDKRIKGNSKDVKAILDRANYKFYTTEDYDGAVEDFNQYLKIVGKPKNNRVFFSLASAMEKAGNINGAIDTYTKCIQLFPDSANAYSRRSQLKKQNGDEAGALADMASYKGIVREKKRDKIERWSKVIEKKPDYVFALHERAKLRMDVGDYKEAENDIKRALEIDPDNKQIIEIKKNLQKNIEKIKDDNK